MGILPMMMKTCFSFTDSYVEIGKVFGYDESRRGEIGHMICKPIVFLEKMGVESVFYSEELRQ